MVEPELLQAGIERATDRVGGEIFIPDFCRDVQVLARDASCCQRGSDGLLVQHLGSVEMSVA